MNKFIERNLSPGEKIIYRAVVHWFIYFESANWFLLGLLIIGLGSAAGITTKFLLVIAWVMFIIAFQKFVKAFLHQYCTEMAITDRRIIAKFGFVRRDVIELPLEKIESVIIDQSFAERLTDAGSVAVRGTGSAMAPVRFIDKPIEFRNQLNEAISNAKNKTAG